METKDPGTSAAVAVLIAILGLIITIGIILLMMWKQPGIEHSPSQQNSRRRPGPASPIALSAAMSPPVLIPPLDVVRSEP
jgi:hypothetical protein